MGGRLDRLKRLHKLHKAEAQPAQEIDAEDPRRPSSVDRSASVPWPAPAEIVGSVAFAAAQLDEYEARGFDRVWVPPYMGSCRMCKALIENKVFTIDELRDATNHGRRRSEWVPAIPLHPQCRHGVLPYIKSIYDEAQAEYRAQAEAGLTEEALNEMFASSGQLKPEYENDPRLQAYYDATEK
jgi:hypothetical protein